MHVALIVVPPYGTCAYSTISAMFRSFHPFARFTQTCMLCDLSLWRWITANRSPYDVSSLSTSAVPSSRPACLPAASVCTAPPRAWLSLSVDPDEVRIRDQFQRGAAPSAHRLNQGPIQCKRVEVRRRGSFLGFGGRGMAATAIGHAKAHTMPIAIACTTRFFMAASSQDASKFYSSAKGRAISQGSARTCSWERKTGAGCNPQPALERVRAYLQPALERVRAVLAARVRTGAGCTCSPRYKTGAGCTCSPR